MKRKLLSWIILPLALASISTLASGQPISCTLSGNPDLDSPLQHEEKLFHGFEFIMDESEIQAGLEKFANLNPWLQTLIRTARLEAITVPIPDESNNEMENIISYMDYLAIDSYWYSSEPAMRLYRVDIGVGGGNGAYEYFFEVAPTKEGNQDDLPKFIRVYEDFDGDLYYCAPMFRHSEVQ